MPRYNTTAPQENGAAFVLHDHENFLWTKKCLLPYISVICHYLTLPIYIITLKNSFSKGVVYKVEREKRAVFCRR